MGEFLSNIKFLKFYAWEEPMSDIIRGTRYFEKVVSLISKSSLWLLMEIYFICWLDDLTGLDGHLILFHTFFHRTFSPK